MEAEWAPWLGRHLAATAVFAMTLVLASGLLRERRSPGSAVAWLFAIILVPYVGIPLYLILGSRKIRRKPRRSKQALATPLDYGHTPHSAPTLERLLLASGAPPHSDGNRIELVSDGVDALERLLRLIDAAQHEIHIETFILGRDATAEIIIEHLIRKARAGVEVRFLLDGLGALMTHPSALHQLKQAGGKTAFFSPLPFRGHSNLRNHRKIAVADGARAITGGMNLADEYMGASPSQSRWVDLAIEVEGPIAGNLASIFASDWKFATGEELKLRSAKITGAVGTEGCAQVVPSGPDVFNDSIYDGLVTAIFEARKRIWISTPYFIPDETLSRALELACRRGVDVRVLVPRRSNHLLPDIGRGSYLRQIQEEGAKILLYPKMVHAKATLIDERCAIVGSANTDMRSFFFNYEVCVFLYSDQEIAKISSWFEQMSAQASTRYPKAGLLRQTIEGVCRILSPLL